MRRAGKRTRFALRGAGKNGRGGRKSSLGRIAAKVDYVISWTEWAQTAELEAQSPQGWRKTKGKPDNGRRNTGHHLRGSAPWVWEKLPVQLIDVGTGGFGKND